MIADNRLTENASWDDHLLGQQLKTLAEADLHFSLETTGFEMAEIDLFIEGLDEESDADSDAADVIPEPPDNIDVTRTGDCWLLGPHRVVCGNALEPTSYTKLMNGKQAALVFADPPYNVPIHGYATGLGKVHHANFVMASGEMNSEEFTVFLSRSLGAAASHEFESWM